MTLPLLCQQRSLHRLEHLRPHTMEHICGYRCLDHCLRLRLRRNGWSFPHIKGLYSHTPTTRVLYCFLFRFTACTAVLGPASRRPSKSSRRSSCATSTWGVRPVTWPQPPFSPNLTRIIPVTHDTNARFFNYFQYLFKFWLYTFYRGCFNVKLVRRGFRGCLN